MRSIICPNCHTTIDIDESNYNAILNQVRTEEFESEVSERVKLLKSELESKFKASEIELKSTIRNMELEKDVALEKAVADKNIELEKILADKKVELEKAASDKKVALEKVVADKKSEIDDLHYKLLSSKTEMENQRQNFENMLRIKDEQIEQYKDFKAKQSTKMIGESLEQYCWNEFNKYRANMFPTAYFEKDNEVSKSGSKGDFIFRDTMDDIEYISIMFEMKNECDTTASKHKNEDFFKELDKDRNEKKCEYAVLVSMLEADNDCYNQGIVDVSYRYNKMYVIRPQFFIPFITMLQNASMGSVGARRELVKVKQENFDVVKFMDSLEDFKSKFGRNYSLAEQRFTEAIVSIDKTIDYLQKVRDALTVSTKHLSAANKQAQDLSIKKLTKDNPGMLERFKKEGYEA